MRVSMLGCRALPGTLCLSMGVVVHESKSNRFSQLFMYFVFCRGGVTPEQNISFPCTTTGTTQRRQCMRIYRCCSAAIVRSWAGPAAVHCFRALH
jgi:hypothetical protein